MTEIKVFLTGILLGVTGFLGGYDVALKALLIFMVIDYITGVAAAFYSESVSSQKGIRGITKKVMQLLLVVFGVAIDSVMGLENPWIRTGIVYFLLTNEGFSIIENFGRCGIPIPDFLKKVMEQIPKGRGGASS